jgi:hypothetical protein
MRTTGVLCLLVVAAGLAAVPAGSQVISGQVVEAETDRPIPFGEVTVLDEDGDIVATTFADGGGRFSVRLPRSGTFTVYAARLGYFNAVSEGIEVTSRQEVAIAVRLAPAPLTVDSLAVEVEGRSLPLLREGFYDRKNAGQGHFITREDIASMIGVRALPDVIREVPGVRITSDGFGKDRVTLRGTFGGSCLPMLVLDGMAIHPPWEDILEVEDVEGVEVYPRPSQIPARFEGLTPDRSRGGASAQCGIVVAWSRQGQRED